MIRALKSVQYCWLCLTLTYGATAMARDQTLEQGRNAYQRHDYATAQAILLPLAQSGIAKAQVLMGNMYLDGEGVKADVDRAFLWFQAAAAQGDSEGEVAYAHMYHNGRGTKRDFTQALRWFSAAASHGDAEAAYQFANMYAAGEGTAQNFAEAARWYVIAADKRHAYAMFHLGLLYKEGHGVEYDIGTAHMYLTLANFYGVSKARNALNDVTRSLTKGELQRAKYLLEQWNSQHKISTSPAKSNLK